MEFPLIKVAGFALFIGALLWLAAMVFMGDYAGDWGVLFLPLCLPSILFNYIKKKKIYGAIFILIGGMIILFFTSLVRLMVDNLDSG